MGPCDRRVKTGKYGTAQRASHITGSEAVVGAEFSSFASALSNIASLVPDDWEIMEHYGCLSWSRQTEGIIYSSLICFGILD